MTQNGLEMVPIASGSPGNLFLQYNNVFLYYKNGTCFPIIYYPYSRVRFPIPLVDAQWMPIIGENSWIGLDWIGLEWIGVDWIGVEEKLGDW